VDRSFDVCRHPDLETGAKHSAEESGRAAIGGGIVVSRDVRGGISIGGDI
jgi:hypothetical protein